MRAGEFLTSTRAVREALRNPAPGVRLHVAGSGPRTRELSDLATRVGVPIVRHSGRELSRLTGSDHDCALELPSVRTRHTTIASVAEHADESSVVLVLDHVLDPQNFGAILRSADQFSVDAVIVPERRAAPVTATVIQASAGTAQHVSVITVKNIVRAIEELQGGGFWVYAAEMSGEPAYRARLTGRTAIVMGSEGRGVSRLAAERSDSLVSIPISGHADSLNVSVACGILLYEIRRQQATAS